MENKERHLKDHFLKVIDKGELGSTDDNGVIVTLKEFKQYFSNIKTDYTSSFLAACTGMHLITEISDLLS